MLGALDQVLPAGGHGFMDDLRIGEAEVGGADSIQELAQEEGQLALLLGIQAFDALHGLEPGGCGQQVALFECIEERVLLPVRGAEAFIAGLRLDHRFALRAQSPQREGAAGHHLRVLPQEVTRESPETRWISQSIQPHALEDSHNFAQINRHDFAGRMGIPEPVD